MKKFEFPDIQVEKFGVEDVITESSTVKEDQLPTFPGGFGGDAVTPLP